MLTKRITYLLLFVLALTKVSAQDESPFVTYDVPAQNLLKYNRFLINPTFSTVREDKSYVNLLHRNQSVSFDDNNQTYFLSYSGRINDRTGLGVSLYTQREGVISNFGVLANYAYGIKLSDKSNFTFGANVSYYNSGFDENRANAGDLDPLLVGFQDSSLLSFQPGFNVSYGNFDLGVFAENLFDYNIRTSESVTAFRDKTFSGHLQYTHSFENGNGVFEGGRLMPLARARKVGEEEVVLGGNLILDLPKIGWLQGGYDSFFGASAGIGFNLNRRLSLGYTMEKGLSNEFDNFGLTHEISFAYSFTPNLTEDRVMLEDSEDDVAYNEEDIETADLTSKDAEIEELMRRLAENDAILAELMYRQDSIETGREKDLERRFEMVMRMVRNETNGNRPDIEEKAKRTYFINNDKGVDVSTALASETTTDDRIEDNTYDVSDNPKNDASNVAMEDAINEQIKDTDAIVENKIKPKSIKKNEIQKDAIAQTNTNVTNYPVRKRDNTREDSFTESTNKGTVKSRRFRNLEGVDDGYYIVANVYKGEQYMNKFVNELNEEGVPADYFTNHNNGLKYVYLERHNTWQEALEAYQSSLGGNYSGTMWIMNVDNRYTNEAYANNVQKIKKKSSQYGADVLQKNVIVKDKVADTNPVSRNINVSGVDTGYYIIANVFANPNNANRFVKLLNGQGLSAGYFINPENNYRYVYLKKHGSWNNALISYYSKLNNAYDEKMWIMRVTQDKLA